MAKALLPLALLLLLAACGEADTELPEENATEVDAPEGVLDPTSPEEVDEAEAVSFSDVIEGAIPEGDPVLLSGTVEELTDDGAFIMFVLSADDEQILIRNMAETTVEVGQTVTVEGIYEGIAEEDMPLVSVSVIRTD